jgi:hypothetical protein
VPKKFESALRLLSLTFAAILLYECVQWFRTDSGFSRLNIPASLPVLAKDGRAKTLPQVAVSSPIHHGPGKPVQIPPLVQNELDQIYQSELLGPVMHPLPMALLGIGGKDAFIRAPTGQTGLLREGEELGGIKLLRIGTNRVLVEQDGKQQELTIFSGFGGKQLVETENKK